MILSAFEAAFDNQSVGRTNCRKANRTKNMKPNRTESFHYQFGTGEKSEKKNFLQELSIKFFESGQKHRVGRVTANKEFFKDGPGIPTVLANH